MNYITLTEVTTLYRPGGEEEYNTCSAININISCIMYYKKDGQTKTLIQLRDNEYLKVIETPIEINKMIDVINRKL